METLGEIVERQHEFFKSDVTKNIEYRIEQLKKLKSLLKENESLLFSAIYEDFGKSDFETYMTELSLLYVEINNFIKNTAKWSKRKYVSSGVVNFPAISYIFPEPLGVTLVIGAWNYPYQLSLLPAVSSIAAGNTVVLKPSELPLRTSHVMANIVNRSFPAEFFYVYEGGVNETTNLLKYKFDKIFFTGSNAVGRIVYQAAAKNMTPVTLELGGKSPAFVLSDCNVKMAAKRIVWAKFLNAGQTCVAPDYIIVEKSVEERLFKALVSELKKYPEDSTVSSANYLKIINEKNFDRLNGLIIDEKVFYGGIRDRKKLFISPTLMKNISFNDVVMQEEIFGPILPLITFTDLDEIINKLKGMPKPLSCYVFSSHKKRINKILKNISFGGGAVNDSLMHLSNIHLPFGGVGASGIGSYHGKAGFNTFSHYKSILKKSTLFESGLKYFPYTSLKYKIIRFLLK